MTTKTDTRSVMELKDKYRPAVRGILSDAEATLVSDTLELKSRSDIELQNVRDVTVMLYSQWTQAAEDRKDTRQVMVLMDAMSGACAAIDQEKIKRGIPV